MGVSNAFWCAHNASLSFLDQSVWFAFTILDRIFLISLLDILTCPIICRWQGVTALYFSRRVFNNLLKKWEALSLMISQGLANLEKMFLFGNIVTLLHSLLGSTTTSTHFDTLLTTTRIYQFPYELTSRPMKSIPHISNYSITIIGLSESSCLRKTLHSLWYLS